MRNIAFRFFCHSVKTVIAFRKQWYNGNFIQKAVVWYNAFAPRDYTTGIPYFKDSCKVRPSQEQMRRQ